MAMKVPCILFLEEERRRRGWVGGWGTTRIHMASTSYLPENPSTRGAYIDETREARELSPTIVMGGIAPPPPRTTFISITP